MLPRAHTLSQLQAWSWPRSLAPEGAWAHWRAAAYIEFSPSSSHSVWVMALDFRVLAIVFSFTWLLSKMYFSKEHWFNWAWILQCPGSGETSFPWAHAVLGNRDQRMWLSPFNSFLLPSGRIRSVHALAESPGVPASPWACPPYPTTPLPPSGSTHSTHSWFGFQATPDSRPGRTPEEDWPTDYPARETLQSAELSPHPFTSLLGVVGKAHTKKGQTGDSSITNRYIAHLFAFLKIDCCLEQF